MQDFNSVLALAKALDVDLDHVEDLAVLLTRQITTSGRTAPLSSPDEITKEKGTGSCSSLKSLESETKSVGFRLKEVNYDRV